MILGEWYIMSVVSAFYQFSYQLESFLNIRLENLFLKKQELISSSDQHRQHIKKQRHCFVNKGLSNQSYVFSSSHIWM